MGLKLWRWVGLWIGLIVWFIVTAIMMFVILRALQVIGL